MKIAEELRTGVYEETGLTCSAGVAPNRLLAKVLFAIALIFFMLLDYVYTFWYYYVISRCKVCQET